MARQNSEAKLGFFPFPAPCLPLLAAHLQHPADPLACTILDPCAGEGVAITELALAHYVPLANVYAVELASSRAGNLSAAYPAVNLLGPASFMGTGISYNSFSLVYCNPPFADEMGGGRREELTFLIKSIHHTIPTGIIVFICPESAVFSYGPGPESMRRAIACRLEDVEVYRLPTLQRAYDEMVVFGRKRRQTAPEGESAFVHHWWDARVMMGTLGQPIARYQPPPGRKPKRWEQTDYTPEELHKKVLASPLAIHLEPPRIAPRTRPPLPPGRGHTALRLASGDLDGLVWPPSEPPHVIRGIAKKVNYRDDAKCEQSETSSKEVYSERMPLVVRAVDVHGTIYTLTDPTLAQAKTLEPTAQPEPEEGKD